MPLPLPAPRSAPVDSTVVAPLVHAFMIVCSVPRIVKKSSTIATMKRSQGPKKGIPRETVWVLPGCTNRELLTPYFQYPTEVQYSAWDFLIMDHCWSIFGGSSFGCKKKKSMLTSIVRLEAGAAGTKEVESLSQSY